MSKNEENNKSNPIFKENYLNKNFSNLRQKELWSKYIDRHLKIGTEPWSFERWSNNNFVKNALESSAPITDSMVNEIFIGTTGVVGKYLGSSMGKWYANNKEGNMFQHIIHIFR